MTKQGAFRNVLSVNSFSGDYRDGRQSEIGDTRRSKRTCASISLFVFLMSSIWGENMMEKLVAHGFTGDSCVIK